MNEIKNPLAGLIQKNQFVGWSCRLDYEQAVVLTSDDLKAKAKGVPLRLVGVLFLLAVGGAVAESAQIVGVLLVFVLMVGTAATAGRLTGRLAAGVALSAALALAEAWGGLVLAYYTDWPTSFWITLLSVAVYGLSFVPGRQRESAAMAPAHHHGSG